MLGSVEVVDDSGRLALGGPQQRKILAVLLCEPGKTLTFDRLIDVLWSAGDAPDNARRTAISYVSRLRAALGDGWITTTDAGYTLDISAASVDALRFGELVSAAHRLPPGRAVDVLDQALALWRGPVFGDLRNEWWALPTVSRLDELRLAALAQRIDALAAQGWNARALSEVQSLVATHPLRGPFVERLMRGLQATGRTDEALRAFQRYRDELIERTGLDPSPELVALDRLIAEGGQHEDSSDTSQRALRGYILRDVIGQGSFGTVYRATQPQVGRDVAMKVINTELADDRSFIHRFEAEAHMVARLEHPHIVPLYDFWREPGGAYLVFRLLKAGTAEHALRVDGPFSLDRVTRVLEEIGGALSSAHAAGVVHRDVKPANILFDDNGAAYLSDFGIATGRQDDNSHSRTVRPNNGRWSAGSPMYASPEQARDGVADARADQYALAVTVWELLTNRQPFPGASIDEVVIAKLRAPLPTLRNERPDLPDGLDDVLNRASAIHPDDRFETIAAFFAAWQTAIAAGLITATAPSAAAPDRVNGDRLGLTAPTLGHPVSNPFKGLRPFSEVDADDFFGRTVLVEQLREMVARHRFTAVVGPSGSGKSSLVLAGVVPQLRQTGSLVVTLTPGDDPFDALAAALAQIATATQSATVSAESLRMPGGLVNAADELAGEDDLIIVIDQLEELWTATDPDERAAFAAALAELARSTSRARLIATIRADWFDRPLRDQSLGTLVAGATFGVTAMQAEELHEAITEPVARVGVRFEAGLVSRIVAESLDQPGSLPLLQFALTELFDNRSGSTVTTNAYDELGGLAGSVAHQAEAIYASLTELEQDAVRRLFARLVTAGDGGEDTRRRARHSELAGIPDEVVNGWVDRRLLTVDRDRESREPTVEIAHEALIRSWPRLREWLEEDRDWLRDLRGLASASRLWQSGGRDEADLYRGARLAVINEHRRERADALTPDESDFVDASQQLADSERVAAEERAALRERQNRSLRRSLVGLAVVVVAALIAGSIALLQSRRAERSAADARTAQSASDIQSELAKKSAADALAAQKASEIATNLAEGSAADARAAQLTTAIQNLVDASLLQRGFRQDLAALLAIEAYRIDPGKARSALFSTFTRNVGFLGYQFIDDTSTVPRVVPLATGHEALAVIDGGRLVRLDLDTGAVIETLDTLLPSLADRFDYATLLRVSRDGSTAVLAMQGVAAMVWRAYNIASGRPLVEAQTVGYEPVANPAQLIDPNGFHGFGDGSLSNDGSLFAVSGGPTGHVHVYATHDGSEIGRLQVAAPEVGWEHWPVPWRTASVAFDPDGTLYVGGPTGQILVVDPSSAVNGLIPVLPENTIAATRWGVEYGLRLAFDERDETAKYLITFGSGALSRVDLSEGTTTWMSRGGSANLLLGIGVPIDGLNPCRDVAVAVTTDRFYCARDFGAVYERDASDGTATRRTFDRQSGPTASISLTSDNEKLLAGSYASNALAAWRLDGGGPVQHVIAQDKGSQLTGDNLTSGYNSDGSSIVSAGPTLLTARVLDPTTGATQAELAPNLGNFTWTADPDELWVVFLEGTGGTVRRFNVRTQTVVPGAAITFEGDQPVLYDDAPHDRLYLLWGHQIKVYDQHGQYIGPTIPAPQRTGDTLNSVWPTPDGTKLVVSWWYETHLFDAVTGKQLDTPSLPLMLSIVSPNGVAAGSTADGRIYLFDPNTLQKLVELPGGSHGYIEGFGFSRDGSILVAANESDGQRIYDVANRTELGDPLPYDDRALGFFVSVRPDGKMVAIPNGPLGVALWDLEPTHWLNAACQVAGRNLTPEEWDQYLGGFGPYHETCVAGKANA